MVLSEGTSGTRCDYGVLKGQPFLWVRCAGTVGAHGCCGCGVAPPQRPSPLRVCSWLNKNELTGSVPSSLSALTNLFVLCVAPSCQWRLRVRLMLGRIGRLCSERAACRGHRAGAVRQQGRCGALRGDRGARDVTEEYSRGTLPMGPVRGYRRGTSLLWVRRSTARAAESASGVQIPPLQRADGECAELALRAHQSCGTVRAPFLPMAFARAADEGRIGRLCSERAACRGVHVWGIEPVRCGKGCCGTLRADPWHAM